MRTIHFLHGRMDVLVKTRWWFQFLFLPLLGEMIQSDYCNIFKRVGSTTNQYMSYMSQLDAEQKTIITLWIVEGRCFSSVLGKIVPEWLCFWHHISKEQSQLITLLRSKFKSQMWMGGNFTHWMMSTEKFLDIHGHTLFLHREAKKIY